MYKVSSRKFQSNAAIFRHLNAERNRFGAEKEEVPKVSYVELARRQFKVTGIRRKAA